MNIRYFNLLKESINSFIDDYAYRSSYGYSLDIHQIPKDELGELVALFLEAADRDVIDCFYTNSNDSANDDITCALLDMLKSNSNDNREKFAELVFENALNRYQHIIQDLIDECCQEKSNQENRLHGLTSYQDEQTGEYLWAKAS